VLGETYLARCHGRLVYFGGSFGDLIVLDDSGTSSPGPRQRST
jgi:hypothetical protein